MEKENTTKYVIADARDLAKHVETESVDVVITSPPYWNLKDYDTKSQIGFGQKYEEYLSDLVDILHKCHSLLKNSGSMWIVVDSFKKGGNVRLLPFEISHKLQEKGWHLQDVIIWQKDKTLPWTSKGKLRNIFEYILFFTKSETFNYYIDELREFNFKQWWVKYPERYNPRGKVPSCVWDIPIPVQGGWGKAWVRHFCPFPPLLVQKILLLTTKGDDLVLDPFAGSGSVLAQAKVMGRAAVGLDLNKSYKKMYHNTVLPFYKDNWKDRSKEIKKDQFLKQKFENTIRRLRQLKFPALLAKKILRNEKISRKNILAIIHQGQANSTSPKYTFVINNVREKEKIQRLTLRISGKAPFTKFGFRPELFFQTLSSLKTKFKNSELYLYRNGVTNIFDQKLFFIKAIKLTAKDELPPVLSKIKVNQKDHSFGP